MVFLVLNNNFFNFFFYDYFFYKKEFISLFLNYNNSFIKSLYIDIKECVKIKKKI